MGDSDMSDNATAGKGGLLKIGKGFLTNKFNALAADLRVTRVLKNMNEYQLRQAIAKKEIENPETGEKHKLSQKQEIRAQILRLKKSVENRLVPK
jgi:hypothetical protein